MKQKNSLEYKREQRKKKLAHARKKQNKGIFKVGGILAVLVVIVLLAFQSGIFTVTKIEVVGNQQLKEGQILKAAAAPKNSSYFSFPVSEVEKRVSTLPWVNKAEVSKHIPGTIIIKVSERKPLGYISSNGVLYIVDINGKIVTTESYKKKLPMIEGLQAEKLAVGKQLKSDSLDNVVLVFKSLPKEIKSKIFSIVAPTEDDLSFVINGIEIIYGSAESVDIKNKVIQRFINSKDREIISTVDVRVPERPVIKKIGK